MQINCSKTIANSNSIFVSIPRTAILVMSLALVVCVGAPAFAQELERQATWQQPDNQQMTQWIEEWAAAAKVDAATGLRDLDARISQHPQSAQGVVLELIVGYFPHTAETIKLFGRAPEDSTNWRNIIEPQLFETETLPASARHQIRLVAGCWLARHQRYDDALELLDPLTTEQVFDPSQLLFHRGLSQQRLLMIKPALETLNRLQENEGTIPRRYATVAELMINDMESLELDSLDEVSRLMQDIRRRQALHRSGTRVIDQEKAVLEKLDQMIEELEEKMQQQQSQSASAQSQQGSSQPMQESQNSGGKGSGEVTERDIDGAGDWGSLPPKKRAAALAEMAKDMPPHYREVIEEYFRQLAREPAPSGQRSGKNQ